MKPITLLCVSLGAALLVSACTPRTPPVVAQAPAANKVWARADGQRMAGNPALTRQGQTDLTQCRALAAVGSAPGQYDLMILNGCMTSRGYVEREI
jgi:hypothetical protein